MRVIDRCLHHPNYLEELTAAHGQGQPLPTPPTSCVRCEHDFDLFEQTQELLDLQRPNTRSALSSNWQQGVWMALAQAPHTAHPDHIHADNVVPFTGEYTGTDKMDTPQVSQTSTDPHQLTQTPAALSSTRRSMWSLAAVLCAGVLLGLLSAHLPTLFIDSAPKEHESAAHTTPPRVMLQAYSFRGDRVDPLSSGSRITTQDTLSFDYWNIPGSTGIEMRYLSIIAVTQPHTYAFASRREDDPLETHHNDRGLQWIADARPIHISHDDEPLLLEKCEARLKAPAGKTVVYGVFSHDPLARRRVEWIIHGQLTNRDLRPMQIRISRVELEMLPENIFVEP